MDLRSPKQRCTLSPAQRLLRFRRQARIGPVSTSGEAREATEDGDVLQPVPRSKLEARSLACPSRLLPAPSRRAWPCQ
eukprot:scaffold7741_cov305-Pinguiococcus_pyrenoidosus.AAC.1